MRVIYYLIILSIILSSFAVVGADQDAAAGEHAVPVEVVLAKAVDVTDKIESVGTLQSVQSVDLASEILSRVKNIAFKEGECVTYGQTLIKLDDAELKAELNSSEAALRLSEANAKRIQELYKKNASSKQQLDEATTNLAKSKANYNLAKQKLNKAIITAPFAGIIGLNQVHIGDIVKPGQNLVNLEHNDELEITLAIPEKQHSLVKIDDKIVIKTEIYPNEQFYGKVYAIDPRIDKDTYSLSVKAKIANSELKLRPGNFADIIIESNPHQVVMIPEQAIVRTPKGNIVFKIVSDKAQTIPVITGNRDKEGNIEIVSGIQAGDMLVSAGQMKLADGVKVNSINIDSKP